MAYEVQRPDRTLSPFTGMTREHWLESGRFLLRGVFQHVPAFDAPILMPKQHAETYPQPADPPWKFKAAEFEGLARTLMLAAPVVALDPDFSANGIRLVDYYANQILLATDPASPRYLGRIADFQKEFGRIPYPHSVEGAALAIGLMHGRAAIWDRYSEVEKSRVAALLSDYAHSRTIGHNGRFFNVLMLTFLKLHGFPIDENALRDHLQHLMSFYVGDGWYRDDVTYDFYNPWGFHFYGPLWCSWYGYEHEPELAAIIEERNRVFLRTYPRMFGREGRQLMWGRGIIHRCAASTALSAAFLLKKPAVNPGWARRIASGNLLQFLGREDVYVNGVPCLGYYGPFAPLVQICSCAASPFWIAKTYTALALPADSPFWTAREGEGHWPALHDRTESVFLEGPGIQIVNHGAGGATEIQTAKVPRHDPFYNQLAFHTLFPCESECGDGANGMNYSIREFDAGEPFRIPLNILFCRHEDGVFYRQMDMKPGGLGDPNKGGIDKGPEKIDLADIVLPGGMLRVDRVRVPYRNELHLGQYALPHVAGPAATVTRLPAADGVPAILGAVAGRKVALVAVHGWDGLDAMRHTGCHPEAPESTVVYAHRTRREDYAGMEILVTVLLSRLDDGDWTPEELNPVERLDIVDWTASGHPCGVRLALRDGRKFEIDYGDLEGHLI